MKIKYIMLILALSIAGCAAYFSIWGLSQLFAGAATAVIVMASVLEVGKIVTTTVLHNYWGQLSRSLKIYLTISVSVLMIITSAGIYGFLSNAYQKTANKLEVHEGEIGLLVGKQNIFKEKIKNNDNLIKTKQKEIDNINNRLDIRVNVDYSNARQSRNADKQNNIMSAKISELNQEITTLNNEKSIFNDSVGSYDIKILELKSNSEISGEIGPLKYISELTGIPMANVVNYMILLLIFVFDPLAVALILATNKIFEIERTKNNQPLDLESDPEIIEEPEVVEEPEVIEEVEIIEEPEVIEEVEIIEEPSVIDAISAEMDNRLDYLISEPVGEVAVEEVEDEQKVEPVIPTGKINVEDIKEKKQNRGFSVEIPKPNSNTIERIGSNKIVKNGENNRVIFRRD